MLTAMLLSKLPPNRKNYTETAIFSLRLHCLLFKVKSREFI